MTTTASITSPNVLILYYSKYGTTRDMAYAMAEGVTLAGGTPVLRTVPELSPVVTEAAPSIPPEGALYCTEQDVLQCHALALGSATRFGNMAAPLKYFLDTNTASVWLSGALQGKPACVFTASGTQHGGQETTLLTMMLPLLHHGMLVMGLPYSLPELTSTQQGGTPYGATRVTGPQHNRTFSPEERILCVEQGKRLCHVAKQLMAANT